MHASIRVRAITVTASAVVVVAIASLTTTVAFSIIPSQHGNSIGYTVRPYGRAPFSFSSTLLKDTDVEVHEQASSSSSKPDDESEWKAVLSCFKMYKAAYGDLKVPSRFVVPSMPPWPESGWGIKLGAKVSQIRSTGKFIEGAVADERRQVLDDIGFHWRLRSPSPDKGMDGVKFEQIYDALERYKEKFGNLDVPTHFVVPAGPEDNDWPEHTRGLPLGGKLSTVRSRAYLKNKTAQRQKLESLGLELDGKVAANSARYKLVYDTLVRYKEIYGDLLVPQPFIVPQGSSEWKEEMWGLRLGARVNAIRSQGTFVNTEPSRRDELTELGFVWEQSGDARRRGRKKKSVELEESVKGILAEEQPTIEADTDVPKVPSGGVNEVIPENDIFSTLFPGSDLSPTSTSSGPSLTDASAVIANQIMKSSNAPSKKAKNPATVVNPIASAATDALKADLPAIIDRDLDNLEGIELKDIWHLLTPDEQEDSQLDRNPRENIEWQFDDYDGYSLEDIVGALKHYYSLHGNFDIDPDFVVPSFNAESAAAAAAAMAAMQEDSEDTDFFNEELLEFGSDEAEWPGFFEGMRLGNIVARMRSGDVEVKHDPEKKAMFDAIDFDWGDERLFLEAPYEKTLCAIWVYFQIRGDSCVDLEFRIPDEEPWPEALAHFPLGHAINFLRKKRELFDTVYREKWRFLYRFDFLWLPPVEQAAAKPFYEHYRHGLEQ